MEEFGQTEGKTMPAQASSQHLEGNKDDKDFRAA